MVAQTQKKLIMKKAIVIAKFSKIGSQKDTNDSDKLTTWITGGEEKEIEVEFKSSEKVSDKVLAVQAFWLTFNTEYYASNCAYSSISLKVKKGSIQSI